MCPEPGPENQTGSSRGGVKKQPLAYGSRTQHRRRLAWGRATRGMISLFDIFKVGIGPSSSHTVGPMRAALRFMEACAEQDAGQPGGASPVAHIRVTLYGSLAWTASGHATDKAVILGLCGEHPETVRPDQTDAMVAHVRAQGCLPARCGLPPVRFAPETDIVLDKETQPPNTPTRSSLRRLTRPAPCCAPRASVPSGAGLLCQKKPRTAVPTRCRMCRMMFVLVRICWRSRKKPA